MLQIYDYQILDYINKFEEIAEEQILSKFPEQKFSTKSRLLELSSTTIKPEPYLLAEHILKDNSLIWFVPTGKYRISNNGKKHLQDYKAQVRYDNKVEFRRSLIYPMIVAFFTALITTILTQKLMQP